VRAFNMGNGLGLGSWIEELVDPLSQHFKKKWALCKTQSPSYLF